MLHSSAADAVKHCQSEVTVESVTIDAVLFELLCIRDGSHATEFEDSVLTILAVSVDSDVLDVFSFFIVYGCLSVFMQFLCTIS